jgi:hypothetical protein
LVFHVQTEDSGVDNPHIFTHLFHGGVILSSRKMTYDPASAEDVVKSLMQAQHKAVLKELKSGTFAEKIEAYLGDNPDLLPRGGGGGKKSRARGSDVSEAINALSEADVPADEPAEVHSPAPESAAPPPGEASARVGTYSKHRKSDRQIASTDVRVKFNDSASKRIPPSTAARRAAPTTPTPSNDTRRAASRPSSGGVVVSRPAVIVGAPPKVVGSSPKPARPARARKAREESQDGIFGQDLISEKSLDEVILAYLSEDGSEE